MHENQNIRMCVIRNEAKSADCDALARHACHKTRASAITIFKLQHSIEEREMRVGQHQLTK